MNPRLLFVVGLFLLDVAGVIFVVLFLG